MRPTSPSAFTTLFKQWRDGDQEAGERLFEMIYRDLLRLARSYLKNDRAGQSIRAHTLVHETYLRLFGDEKVDVECRAHFFVIATRQMRRILVDIARKNRGREILTITFDGQSRQAPFEDASDPAPSANLDLLALDEAMARLEKISPRSCRVVELRFFAGLTEKEAAQALGVSLATLKRDWTFARTWLFSQLHHSKK